MKLVVRNIAALTGLALGLLAVPTPSHAAELNLTGLAGSCQNPDPGCGGTAVVDNGITYWSFAGALWTTSDSQATGSGVIDSFVRISGANELIVDGMNTDYRGSNFSPNPENGTYGDENSSATFTHSLKWSAVPELEIDGKIYYEFLLDINQTNVDPLLALDGLKLCYSSSNTDYYQGTCGPNVIYDLDGAINDTVRLNYALNSGSGSGDLFFYVEKSLLPVNENKNLYLWSQFGATVPHQNNDGYEEWAVRQNLGSPSPFNPPGVPEPGSLVLLGTGLLLGGNALRRRLRSRTAAD